MIPLFHLRLSLAAFLPAMLLPFTLHAQIVREWVATWNGEGDFNDRFTCAVRDASGNAYLAGSATNNDRDRDYLVLKLTTTGTQAWRAEMDGEGHGADEVTAIGLDAAGHVIVTGFSKSANNGTDYLTVMYDANGSVLWTAVYNNPLANGYDQANALAIDAGGNVVVTGQSDGDPGSAEFDDYATVKYSAVGAVLWVQRHDGPGNATDRATGLGIDASGNVLVTGRSDNGSNDDYVTIKYSPAGTQQWIQFADRGGRDRAVGLMLDASGNSYVTGRSDNGNNDDIWTVKYDPAGNQLWQQPYDFVEDDRAIDMVLDAAGNVYVTGQSDGDASPFTDLDHVTIAYNSTGAQLWSQRYNSSVSNDDVPAAIATDGSLVYVTGVTDVDAGATVQNDAITRCHSAANGNVLWSSTNASPGGLDDEARAVVAMGSGCLMAGANSATAADRNALAVRYDANGSTQWQADANGAGDNNENIRDMAVDGTGNIYAVGYTTGSRENRNMALWKFEASGALVCVNTFNGSSPSSSDEAQGIALTSSGDPVAAGFSKNSGESNNITCFRSDPATCDTAWTNMVLTPANGSDKVYDIVRDAAGDFFLTGRIDSDPSFAADDDLWVAKMNAAGTLVWNVSYGSGAGLEDRGSYIRVATSGNVYVTGRRWNGADYDVLTVKYNASGAMQWAEVYDGGNGGDEPAGLAIDAAENIIVAASSQVAGDTTFNAIVLTYDQAGAQQSLGTFDGGDDDQAAALALSTSGRRHLAVTSDLDPGVAEDLRMQVVTFDAAGNVLWTAAHNTAGTDDHADDITVNQQGQVLLTGHTNGGSPTDPDYDATTLLFAPDGTELWSDTYASPGDSSDIPSRIALTTDGFVVGGYTTDPANMRDAMVIKYTGTITAINEPLQEAPMLYPSPFDDVLHVTGARPGTIELLDATGRCVLRAGIASGTTTLATAHLPAGTYIYHLTTRDGVRRTGRVTHIH